MTPNKEGNFIEFEDYFLAEINNLKGSKSTFSCQNQSKHTEMRNQKSHKICGTKANREI